MEYNRVCSYNIRKKLIQKFKKNYIKHTVFDHHDGGAVGVSVGPASERLSVQIPAATYLNRKTGTEIGYLKLNQNWIE